MLERALVAAVMEPPRSACLQGLLGLQYCRLMYVPLKERIIVRVPEVDQQLCQPPAVVTTAQQRDCRELSQPLHTIH